MNQIMIKRLLTFVCATAYCFCHTAVAQDLALKNCALSILPATLRQHVELLASDSLQGRETGTPGGWMAADYIASCFERYGLTAPYSGSYFQEAEDSPTINPRNVVGVVEGSGAAKGAIVVCAHYDHHGMHNYAVYNGADDNASGVAAMLEIAKASVSMKRSGYTPPRTLIFIAFDAKESNMAGSEWYAKYPLVPLKETVACLNMDMLGRIDAPPTGDTNYVLVVGADRRHPALREAIDEANTERGVWLDTDYTYYGSPAFYDMFYKISDQYNFGVRGVPSVYYTSGMHDDLWKPGDDAYKLSYPVLQKRTQLVFYTAWLLAYKTGY
jgi:hypothetical protein